jgi:hypothetical protein
MTAQARKNVIARLRQFLRSEPMFPECMTHEGGQRKTTEAAKEWAQSYLRPPNDKLSVDVSLGDLIQSARKLHAPADEALRELAKLSRMQKKSLPTELIDYLADPPPALKSPSKAFQGRNQLLLDAIALACMRSRCHPTRNDGSGDDVYGGKDCGCSLVAEALSLEGFDKPGESGLEQLWNRKRRLRPAAYR